MFRNQARKDQEALLQTVEPYLGLAQNIAQDVEEARADLERDMDGTIGRIISNITSNAFKELVTAQFETLPPSERSRVLMHTFPDEALQQALAEERRLAIERQGVVDDTTRMIEQGRQAQHIDLSTLPIGSIAGLSFYEAHEYTDVKGDRQQLITEYGRARYLRGSIAEGGKLHILEDTYDTNYYEEAIPYLKPHTIRTLGHTAGDGVVKPILYYAAPVEIEKKKSVAEIHVIEDGQQLDLLLMGLQLNDQEVFDY